MYYSNDIAPNVEGSTHWLQVSQLNKLLYAVIVVECPSVSCELRSGQAQLWFISELEAAVIVVVVVVIAITQCY